MYDIGSLDVNGSHRSDVLESNNNYIGCDVIGGNNVDIIINEDNWDPLQEDSIDYVISGSCLEHVKAPWVFSNNLYRVMKKQSIAIICMPFKIGEHRYPVDCYRILPDGLMYLFGTHQNFRILECGFTENKTDTYIILEK